MKILYYVPSLSAMAGSLFLTGYSASTSWALTGDPAGVMAAVGASLMLMLAVHFSARHRQRSVRVLAALVGMLGITAAVISGALVKQRVATGQVAQVQAVRDANLPRKQAELALASAESELKTAAADANAECRTGNGKRCKAMAEREAAARGRAADARTKVSGAGAHAVEVHAAPEVAALLPVLLPWWVEASAPILAALCVATLPLPNPTPASEEKPRKGRKAERARPRKGTRRKAVTRAKYGTAAYWLARLDDARPDLARAVRAGEISANMAAIKAGWRKSPIRLVASP